MKRTEAGEGTPSLFQSPAQQSSNNKSTQPCPQTLLPGEPKQFYSVNIKWSHTVPTSQHGPDHGGKTRLTEFVTQVPHLLQWLSGHMKHSFQGKHCEKKLQLHTSVSAPGLGVSLQIVLILKQTPEPRVCHLRLCQKYRCAVRLIELLTGSFHQEHHLKNGKCPGRNVFH